MFKKKTFTLNSLKGRILLNSIVIIIFALGLTNGINYYNSNKLIEEIITKNTIPAHIEKSTLYLKVVFMNINNFVESSLANNILITHWIENDNKDINIIKNHLNRSKRFDENILDIGIITTQGKVHTYMHPNDSMNNLSYKFPWFNQFLKSPHDNYLYKDSDGDQGAVIGVKKIYSENNQLLGVAFSTCDLDQMINYITSKKLGQKGKSYLINNSGNIIISNNNNDYNRSIFDYSGLNKDLLKLSDIPESGSKINYNDGDDERQLNITPIHLSDWMFVMDFSKTEQLKPLKDSLKSTILVSFICFIISLVIVNIGVKKLDNYIQRLVKKAKSISQGDFKNDISLQSFILEFQAIEKSFSRMEDALIKATKFAQNIGKNELETEFKASGEKDLLSKSLLEMRDSLIDFQNKENKRIWITEGISLFNEITRNEREDLTSLGDAIVKSLVKYTNANQAGLFITNINIKGEKELILASTYAYNRKKHLQKSVKPGESLVGQCYLEKEPIYLNEIPEDYINITSGLGTSNPKSIYLTPMIYDNQVVGIIEIASFATFEKYHKELIDNVAQIVASSISTIQINKNTQKLLEETNLQTQELREQEEEMRQNLEELMASREEINRQEKEYLLKINRLEEKIKELEAEAK
ncbi:cache domain-containing protein [Aureibacter tunicatorum]|uniref:Methyl-accepting chemotaxis protein n=1 Tax=Aureibacter tunicatorum TaxID=866807 RepID=A0AAE3XLX1_9BACT|nr:cache domain-containing protein [Aureibacter tunicatorum]MDR6238998.1 methyl-accepting chemotaxis protein [Aureibacter tunicatorum]BDD05076.1 hypothetical protein AUTU_25590 [Aureibacter tunicatorum]